MALDFKKERRDLYAPATVPAVVTVPAMTFIAVAGQGDPNDDVGQYAAAVQVLYALSYAIRMSHKGAHAIDGYVEYVVPPLEGLWWMADGTEGVDYADKAGFAWVSMIRQPDFVTPDVLEWAGGEVRRKKKLDVSGARLFTYDEGFCVQCLHVGPYDDEPATVTAMDAFAVGEGYALDFTDVRRHHEIYLSDPRTGDPSRRRTIIRHPVR